jgi:hypothetical protein
VCDDFDLVWPREGLPAPRPTISSRDRRRSCYIWSWPAHERRRWRRPVARITTARECRRPAERPPAGWSLTIAREMDPRRRRDAIEKNTCCLGGMFSCSLSLWLLLLLALFGRRRRVSLHRFVRPAASTNSACCQSRPLLVAPVQVHTARPPTGRPPPFVRPDSSGEIGRRPAGGTRARQVPTVGPIRFVSSPDSSEIALDLFGGSLDEPRWRRGRRRPKEARAPLEATARPPLSRPAACPRVCVARVRAGLAWCLFYLQLADMIQMGACRSLSRRKSARVASERRLISSCRPLAGPFHPSLGRQPASQPALANGRGGRLRPALPAVPASSSSATACKFSCILYRTGRPTSPHASQAGRQAAARQRQTQQPAAAPVSTSLAAVT